MTVDEANLHATIGVARPPQDEGPQDDPPETVEGELVDDGVVETADGQTYVVPPELRKSRSRT